ncbi:unnamed protein product [Protopolystoma xenopodis]|uniref:Uncharacterized protein n=1 Tax=Protopolystoma xenopodis TaxID=117903 RepID=A0A448WEH1_9PLAT|nr:unnamed protein product [Protopolystoma xenopodis]
MVSGSDDVRHRTDESSARSHRGGRTVSRGLLRTIQQIKVQGNPPSVSVCLKPTNDATRLGDFDEGRHSVLVAWCYGGPEGGGFSGRKEAIHLPTRLLVYLRLL